MMRVEAKMKSTIKIGDTVTFRGAFGTAAPARAKVESMELTDFPREKYGDDVAEVTIEQVRANRVVFSLDCGNWCYSDQIVLEAE
jgi:hypothetical protein